MSDKPIRPDYYKGRGGLEPIHLIHAFDLGADAAAVVKYVCRHGRKPGVDAIEDLKKARTYLGFMIAEAGGFPVIVPGTWVDTSDTDLSDHLRQALLEDGWTPPGGREAPWTGELVLDEEKFLRGVPPAGQDPLSGNDGAHPTDRAIANSPPYACPDLDQDGALDEVPSSYNPVPLACPFAVLVPIMPEPSMPCDCEGGCEEYALTEGVYCRFRDERPKKANSPWLKGNVDAPLIVKRRF